MSKHKQAESQLLIDFFTTSSKSESLVNSMSTEMSNGDPFWEDDEDDEDDDAHFHFQCKLLLITLFLFPFLPN